MSGTEFNLIEDAVTIVKREERQINNGINDATGNPKRLVILVKLLSEVPKFHMKSKAFSSTRHHFPCFFIGFP